MKNKTQAYKRIFANYIIDKTVASRPDQELLKADIKTNNQLKVSKLVDDSGENCNRKSNAHHEEGEEGSVF